MEVAMTVVSFVGASCVSTLRGRNVLVVQIVRNRLSWVEEYYLVKE